MEQTWIRIAGNAQNIKANKDYHWRFFINKAGSEIPITSWSVVGSVTIENLIPGSAPEKDSNGLNAWIDVYGKYTIKENILIIEL